MIVRTCSSWTIPGTCPPAGYCGLLLQLLQSGPAPDTRARVLSSGALNILLRMLGHRPAGAATSAASAVLQALVASGDVDMQNEIAAQVRGTQMPGRLPCALSHSMDCPPSMHASENANWLSSPPRGGGLSCFTWVCANCLLTHTEARLY